MSISKRTLERWRREALQQSFLCVAHADTETDRKILRGAMADLYDIILKLTAELLDIELMRRKEGER